MRSHDMSRRALFGLGLSRLGQQFDAAGEARTATRAPAAPAFEELAARWEAARTSDGDALWAAVRDALRAAVRDVAGDDRDGVATSVFGPQSTPATRAAIAALFASVPVGGVVGFSVWSTGAVTQLLKAAAEFDPMPPGLPGVWGWGSRERLRQDLDHHADEIRYRSGAIELRAPSLDDAVERLAAAVPALAVALERHGDEVRMPFTTIVEAYAADDDEDVAVPLPYLIAVARRRAG